MCVILKTEVGEYVDIRTLAKQVIIEKGGVAEWLMLLHPYLHG